MQATRTTPLPLRLIACALLTIFSPAVLAQESHNPAEECIEHIGIITHRSVHATQAVAEHTVDAITHLDTDGAPEPIMRLAANEGKETIERQAQASTERIANLVQRCVSALQEHDAPNRIIARVVHAGQWGAATISEAAQRNTARINRALYIALNN